MGTQQVEPDATVDQATWTRTGGSTVHGVLADDSDATYMTPPNDTTSRMSVRFADPAALPTGARISAVSVYARLQYAGTGSLVDLNFSLETVAKGSTSGTASFQFTNTSPQTFLMLQLTKAPDGTAWEEPDLVDLAVSARRIFGVNTDARIIEYDYIEIVYDEAPVVVVTGPADEDPTTTGNQVTSTTSPTVTWTFTDPESGAEEAWRVKVWERPGASWAGFDPDTTTLTPVEDSGLVFSTALSYVLTTVLENGVNYRAYVQACDPTPAGYARRMSAWDFLEFDVAVDTPQTPLLESAAEGDDGVLLTAQGRDNELTTDQATFDTGTGGATAGSGSTVAQSPGTTKEVPTIRGNSFASTSSGTSISITPPTGTASGDLMVLVVAVKGDSSVTTPAGWTLADTTKNGDTASDIEMATFHKTAGATEGTLTVTLGTATDGRAMMVVLQTGTYTGSPTVAGQANASSTTVTAPSATPGVDGTLLLMFGAVNTAGQAGTAIYSPGQNMVELSDGAASATLSGAASWQPYGSTAATGTRTMTATTAGKNVGVSVLVAGVSNIAAPKGTGYLRHTVTTAGTTARTVRGPNVPVSPGRSAAALITARQLDAYTAKNARATLLFFQSDGTTPSATTPSVNGSSAALSETPAQLPVVTTTAPTDAAFAAWQYELESAPQQNGETTILDKASVAPGTLTTWTRGGLLPTQEWEARRSEDGGATWEDVVLDTPVGTGNRQEVELVDRFAPRTVDLLYQVRVTATPDGPELASAWSASAGPVTLSADANTRLRSPTDSSFDVTLCQADTRWTLNRGEDVVFYEAEGRADPIPVGGTVRMRRGVLRIAFTTDAEFEAFEAIRARQEKLLLQTCYGHPTPLQLWVRLGEDLEDEMVATSQSEIEGGQIHLSAIAFREVAQPS